MAKYGQPGESEAHERALYQLLWKSKTLAMPLAEAITVGTNATLAAVLIVAAIGKIISPDELRLAVRELFTSPGIGSRLITDPLVRSAAVTELFAAGLLYVPATRVAGAYLTAVLGALFATTGVLGIARGALAPCGCLGSSSSKPLGMRNVCVGLAMMVGSVTVNLVFGTTGGDPAAYSGQILAISSLLTLLLCLWTNRARIVPAVRKAW